MPCNVSTSAAAICSMRAIRRHGTTRARPRRCRRGIATIGKGGFSDVILFGDCREIHRHMHPLCRKHGVTVNVFEEGYVRPHWMTLESHGVNGRSTLPRDPAWYLDRRRITPRVRPPRPPATTSTNGASRIRYRARTRIQPALSPLPQPSSEKRFLRVLGAGSRALAQRAS